MRRLSLFDKLYLAITFLFLYFPIFYVILYSFNKSKLVTVWGGFSTVWYGKLLEDDLLIDALINSLLIAFFAASASVAIGVVSALMIVRFKKFRGKSLFESMLTAPLVIPDVITGISLLLLFVMMENLIGWPQGRGVFTVWIAHVTFGSAFAFMVIGARLREYDHTLDEAAYDLGCTPLKTFFVVTLPNILPSLVSAWLLAFTLSFDDLVIASFVTGPASTTLPIKIYSSIRLGVDPKINAIATIMILIVVSFALLTAYFGKRKTGKF